MNEREKFPPTHPGKIIESRFFKPRNLTVEEVARNIQVPAYQLEELVAGGNKLDLDLAYRLGLFFGVGAEGFLNLQQIYDLEVWKDRQETVVKKQVHPYRATEHDQGKTF